MNRSVRILLAASVVLTGTSLAMLFRRPASEASRQVQGEADSLVFRERIAPQATMAVPERPTVRIESRVADPVTLREQLPAVLKPLAHGQPPPELAKSYPGSSSGPDDLWDTPTARSSRLPFAHGRNSQHKIVDGDTLTALAQRYLGDSSLWREIFEANQEVLSSPQLLPIGGVLEIPQIPPCEPESAASADSLIQKRLVPLAPRDRG
ncbi:MAG: LysM peptidoglycan-binding domain-containing protein [Rhodopirellula sp.]|nr:LysM peptidoglycan-binding domain-containing protein [Rhodopirellula sp.]